MAIHTDSPSVKLPLWVRLLALTGAVGLLLLAGWLVWQAGLPTPNTALGSLIPFTATTLEGQPLTIDESLNYPVILNFWATWCVPCVVEMPRLEQAYRQYQAEGLLVVGVNSAQEDPRDALVFAINHGLSFPLVMDDERQIESAYDVRGVFPTTVFIDREGQIRQVTYGILSESALQEGLSRIGLVVD